MNYGKDFKKFAISQGISSTTLDSFENSMTPQIIEERRLNAVSMSVFDRLMMDRTIWICSQINSQMASIIQAQLIYLDSLEKKDITLHCDSPGGSVMAGLGIIDVMNYISSDVVTINTGLCASMGAVILSAGKKGKRSSLLYSRTMIHHVSSSTSGTVDDQRVSLMESEKYNFLLMKMLAQNCGKTFDEIHDSSRRDKWMNSDESLEFGIIDEIIGIDENSNITKMMYGFDEYYKKEVLGSN
jgi:ATP-dependent Clp protease, protease subunit